MRALSERNDEPAKASRPFEKNRTGFVIAEGAGIAGVAAVLAGRLDLKGRRVAIVVSGGNIDTERLRAILG